MWLANPVTPMFESIPEFAKYVSRLDSNELLGTASPHSFQLEDRIWPTVEHYIQAMQFSEEAKQEKIRLAPTVVQARKLGKTGFFRNKPRPDWKRVRSVYMTRAFYTKCQVYPEVAEALLATGGETIIESDQYDYYWGVGRDRRGDNAFGKVLVQIRDKLREEQS